jgi:hypothetical protein
MGSSGVEAARSGYELGPRWNSTSGPTCASRAASTDELTSWLESLGAESVSVTVAEG